MSLHVDVAVTAVLFVAAAIAPDQQTQIAAFCGVGAALGGYVGAAQFPAADTTKKLASRWGINFALALFVAPLVTAWIAPQIGDLPIHYVAVVTGGAIGIAGVSLLTIALPALISKVKTILNISDSRGSRRTRKGFRTHHHDRDQPRQD